MENNKAYSISCIKCTNITFPVEDNINHIYYKAQCKREACKAINYLIYCPFCYQELKSTDPNAYLSGKNIICTNIQCKKSFKCIRCPWPACCEVNYFENGYIMGAKVECIKCKQVFQQVTCPQCYYSNYWSGSPDNIYNAGVSTPCWNCKLNFVHLVCPNCQTCKFFHSNEYMTGMNYKCDNCQINLQQANCPCCMHSNYYINNFFKYGKVLQCSRSECLKKFEILLCPHCTKVNLWESNELPSSKRYLTQRNCWSCKGKFYYMICKSCLEPNYPNIKPNANSISCTKCIPGRMYCYNCEKCKKIILCEEHVTHCPECQDPFLRDLISLSLGGSSLSLFGNDNISSLLTTHSTSLVSSSSSNDNNALRRNPLISNSSRSILTSSLQINNDEGSRTPPRSSLFSNILDDRSSLANLLKDLKKVDGSKTPKKSSFVDIFSKIDTNNAKNTKEDDDYHQNNDSQSQNECVICLDKPKDYIFIPCGHLCVCEACGINIKIKCPICRKPFTQKLKVYQ